MVVYHERGNETLHFFLKSCGVANEGPAWVGGWVGG